MVSLSTDEVISFQLSSRTPHQCQVMWYNELHPHLNKGKWSKEEDKLLLKFAEENDTDGNWEKIARELKVNWVVFHHVTEIYRTSQIFTV